MVSPLPSLHPRTHVAFTFFLNIFNPCLAICLHWWSVVRVWTYTVILSLTWSRAVLQKTKIIGYSFAHYGKLNLNCNCLNCKRWYWPLLPSQVQSLNGNVVLHYSCVNWINLSDTEACKMLLQAGVFSRVSVRNRLNTSVSDNTLHPE